MSNKSNGFGGEMGGLIKIETITPAMARELLKRDSRNRPIRKKRVAEYAAEMSTGLWQMNGETIKVAINGDVLDGQHRLNACVLSNSSFETVIVYDLPVDAFRTIDNGAPRSLSDLLNLRGVKNATCIASATPYILYWDTAPKDARMYIDRPSGYKAPTRNQKFAWLEGSNFKIWPDAAKAAWRGRGLCTPSIVAAAYYIMARASRSKADEFFTKFLSGEGLNGADDPVLHLRSRLIKDSVKKNPALPMEKFGWVMKTWFSFLEGRDTKSLRIRTRGQGESISKLRDSIDKVAKNERPAA